LEQADHHIVVSVVVDVQQSNTLDSRADDAILKMKDLGDNVF
jgi:hypothetical protein